MKISQVLFMRKVTLLSALFFLSIALFFYSCKKDGELVPEFDSGNANIMKTDTFTIVTSLAKEDSIRTDVSIYNLLGIYNDPVFGPTASSFYTQATLNGLNVDFGVGAVLDSAVLTLAYNNVYGDTNAAISVNVYEITEQMSTSDSYYSNQKLAYDVTPITTTTFSPKVADSVFVAFEGGNVAPHLRINLGNTFGNKIFAESGTSNLANNANFTQFFKGFYLTTTDSVQNTTLSPGQGAIAYFNTNSSLSTLTLYYNDTSKYDFIINSESAKYNRFDHNYTGTDIEAQLLGGGDSTVSYVQTMAGVKTKLEVPYIKEIIKDGEVVINKAELIVTIESGTDGTYPTIPMLTLVAIDNNGQSVFLSDFFEGLDFFGGSLNTTEKTYTFNIPRHLHSMIYNTTSNNGMYLVATGQSISANRSVITTNKNQIAKLKLNITYTKL
ncbi:MAG TPA: DUF4270 domain-containing protein [Vicingaceae bacterium]